VYLGNVEKTDQFECYEVDELKVFVNRRLDIKPTGLKIFTTGFLFFKTIDVSGVQVI